MNAVFGPWITVIPFSTYFGGSAQNWAVAYPRTHVSFWAGPNFMGGCCSSGYFAGGSWGQPYDMFITPGRQ